MNVLRYFMTPKMLVAGAGLVIASLLGYNVAVQSAARAAVDCDNNAIIKCGYTNPADLAAKAQASAELRTIYNHQFTPGYGMGDINAFKANAKHATVYKDGRVVLDDGTIVGTGATSLGRQKIGNNRYAINIGNTTYYYSATKESFNPDSLPGYVLINEDDHSLKFATLTACGNPIWATSPGYKCQMLTQEKVNDITYNFSTTVYNKNTTLTKLVYDFGDGKTQTVTSNFSQKVQHVYAPGKYTAKVTAYFSANGQEKSDTRAECTKPVDVPQPPKPVFVCDSLTLTQISRTKYSFTAKGASNNATFVSAKFDFGDNQSAGDLKGTGEKVTIEHEYAKEGTYTVKAYLTYKEGVTPETPNCIVKVTINEQTCAEKPNAPECQPPKPEECKPGIPVGDSRCKETPQVLPSTGPAEIIGSTLGLGTLVGAGMYYRSSRRNLLDLILKR
jgi:hypothetical protein